ncbi:MAG: 50S ribosomal protein L13 [bacterium]|nr:50S ribosomal protein L13 [bacterium]MDZ4231397.1 50S ribosomal protein L13 [Patescibacteria group bacterium]
MAEHTIDAKGKPLGRIATQVATLLQDKNLPQYAPHKEGGNKVVVKNIHLVKVTGKKAEQKVYHRHSGQPGHLKTKKYADLLESAPEKILINAVKRMLPQNKLRDRRLKRLVIEKENNG